MKESLSLRPFSYHIFSSDDRPSLRKVIRFVKTATFQATVSQPTEKSLMQTRPLDTPALYRRQDNAKSDEHWAVMAQKGEPDGVRTHTRATSTESKPQIPDFNPAVGEVDSGIRWDRALPGWTAFQNVVCLASQPTKDSTWIRQLYIDAVVYVLKALPSELSAEETARLQYAMPQQVRMKSNTQTISTSRPSVLRRFTSYAISKLVLLFFLVAPFFTAIAAWIYRMERQHQMTGRAFSASLTAANTAAETGLDLGDSLGRFGQGRLGMALKNSAAYCADGLIGGVCDGMSAVRDAFAVADRPVTPQPSTPS